MQLTAAQTATMKSFILTDGTLGPKAIAGDYDFVANALNANASPDYFVWKSSVTATYLISDPAFDWTRVDNLTVGKARIWEWMPETINPTFSNIRAGLAACFSAAGDAATLAAILARCKRLARLSEKQLASGTGSSAVPASLGVFDVVSDVYCEGPINPSDIGGIIA